MPEAVPRTATEASAGQPAAAQPQALPVYQTSRPWNEKEGHRPAPAQPPATGEPQPVAYDQDGRPLYAAPPQQPQMVYMSRPVAPAETHVPDDVAQRHQASVKEYPHLNLSEGEYVILSVKRHPIGIVQIWLIAIVLIGALAGLLFSFMASTSSGISDLGSSVLPLAFTVLALISILILAGACVASYVYNRNRFYLTNESVIQELQNGLFSKREQTVSLGSVEDASYFQTNLIATMFDYGLIRLSTVGDETTYRFNYVTNPKKHIALLNNAVEDFKNGRRVH